MDVNKLTLDKVFDPTVRLEAPLFQRPYVWNQKKNWEYSLGINSAYCR